MPPTHDASQSLEATVADLTLAIGQLLRRLRQDVSPEGLSWSQTSALSRLDTMGPMTIADLARAEGVKPQSMRVTLADLEQEGLVERRPHPTDGRQVLVSPTPKGSEMRHKRSIAKQQWLLAALQKLEPSERQTLVEAVALLRRLGDG